MQVGDTVYIYSTGQIGTIVSIGDDITFSKEYAEVCIEGSIYMPWFRLTDMRKIS